MRSKRFFFLLLIAFTFQINQSINATHIVGGDISAKWTGGNDFEITLKFFWDCTPPNTNNYPSTTDIGLYDKSNNSKIGQYSLPISGAPDQLELGDSCLAFNGCIKVATYKKTISIPNNPNGYYISFQQNSRSTAILNIVINIPSIPPSLTGVTIFTDIPDPSRHNSTPTFDSLINGYMCVNKTNTRSFKCTDIDGDSLVYYLETPLDSRDKSGPYVAPSPKPYTPVTWISVPLTTYYSAMNMIGGNPPMTINSQTGEITANPDRTGIFVFAVRVEEYDRASKVKLGEIRRDVQYSMVVCENLPPQFTSPSEDSYHINAGDSLCFTLKLEDPNLRDSVYFSATSEMLNGPAGQPEVDFSPKRGIKTIERNVCILTSCQNIRDTPYQIIFYGQDSSCYNSSHITKTIDFYVSSSVGYTQDFFPNVFTPNGDSMYDVFESNNKTNACYDEFTMKIFDRWGDKVYESQSASFAWNGKHYKTGKELPEGIYYYAVKTLFQDKSTERKGFITLLR